jgi:hypothetical protein
MAKKTAAVPEVLRRGDKVIATRELRGIPEGTEGTVSLVNGFEWVRYWVRFDNGVSLGSITRKALATPTELEQKVSGGAADGADEAEDAEDAGDGDGDAGGGVTTTNGTLVPQKLIDRAAAARARLAA